MSAKFLRKHKNCIRLHKKSIWKTEIVHKPYQVIHDSLNKK